MNRLFLITLLSASLLMSNSAQAEEVATSTELNAVTVEENIENEIVEVSEAELTPIRVNLRIYTNTENLFNGSIFVNACESVAGEAPSISAYCALNQSGIPIVWNTFGTDAFLDSINGVANDFASNQYWLWFSNLELGSVAMNKHLLVEGEEVLVSIGKMPMKIRVSTTTPYVGATTTIETLQFAFDSSFMPVYENALDAKIVINGEELETQNGILEFVSVSTSSLNIFGRKDGYLDSKKIILNPIFDESATSTVNENIEEAGENNTVPIVSGGGGSAGAQFDISKAITFLISKQNENGSFGDDLYTDWVGIALAANGNSEKEKLRMYLENQSYTGNSVTDFERRAIALIALQISPYNGTSINYIEKVVASFDGEQIGDKSLVNDDIFAIFPLFKSGYGMNDNIMQKTLSFILSKQKADGSWEGSVDLTGASLQAISLFNKSEEVARAVDKAKEFLRNAQREDGGFGDVFATSWAIQGIVATNDSPKNWFKGGKNYMDYFASKQATDGALGDSLDAESTRIWATSYAVPAVLEKTWPSIMASYDKPASLATHGSRSATTLSNENVVTNTATTSMQNILEEIAVPSESNSSASTSSEDLGDIGQNSNGLVEERQLDVPVIASTKPISPKVESAPKQIDIEPENESLNISESLVANTMNADESSNVPIYASGIAIMLVAFGIVLKRFVLPI